MFWLVQLIEEYWIGVDLWQFDCDCFCFIDVVIVVVLQVDDVVCFEGVVFFGDGVIEVDVVLVKGVGVGVVGC